MLFDWNYIKSKKVFFHFIVNCVNILLEMSKWVGHGYPYAIESALATQPIIVILAPVHR